MSDYIAPHSLEAEVSALGAAILSPKACAVVVDLCDPRDFYQSAHATVFDAIRELHTAGTPVDTTTLTDLLGRRDRLDEVGGPMALHDLTVATPTAAAAEHYAEIVVGTANRRRAREAALRFAGQVGEVDDLAQASDDLVARLTFGRTGANTVDPEDVAVAFYKRLTGEAVEAWSCGWSTLDRLYRLPAGLLTTLTGLPGSGKSTVLDVAIYNICRKDPEFRVAFFSPEQGPADKHLVNLVHTSLGRDPVGAHPGLAERIEEHRAWWQERVDWIDDDRDNTPSAVIAVARAKAAQGCRLLVIDPYNNLAPDSRRSSGDRQDLYIQDLLRRLKRFARETGTAVVIVAHPRQVPIHAGTEAVFHTPTAAHISGGQEWWNHSDAVVCVWRNQSGEAADDFGYPQDVKVIIQKVRDAGRWGRQGQVTLRFDADERRYRETRA